MNPHSQPDHDAQQLIEPGLQESTRRIISNTQFAARRARRSTRRAQCSRHECHPDKTQSRNCHNSGTCLYVNAYRQPRLVSFMRKLRAPRSSFVRTKHIVQESPNFRMSQLPHRVQRSLALQLQARPWLHGKYMKAPKNCTASSICHAACSASCLNAPVLHQAKQQAPRTKARDLQVVKTRISDVSHEYLPGTIGTKATTSFRILGMSLMASDLLTERKQMRPLNLRVRSCATLSSVMHNLPMSTETNGGLQHWSLDPLSFAGDLSSPDSMLGGACRPS